MAGEDRERKKEYLKHHYDKRKNLLNHLIHCVEDLENLNLNK